MLPTTLLTGKRRYDIRYASKIETVEDLIRAISMLLPGRFEDSEFCSQTIIAALNLVSLYHTQLLVRAATKAGLKEKLEAENEDGPRFAFNAFIQRHYQGRGLKRFAAVGLSLISYTEVLLEMMASRWWPKLTKWRWIVGIEAVKVLLRLGLFYGTHRRMILHPTHLVRNVDPSTFTASTTDKFELATLDPRIGTPSTANPSLLLTAKDATKTPLPRKGWAHLAEIVWIIRPLVFVTLIYIRLRRRHRSPLQREKNAEDEEEECLQTSDTMGWKPWLLSLGMDLLARTARHMQPMTSLEKDESRRRDYLLLYYLLRGPFYLYFTKPLLDTFCSTTEHRPVISIITSALNDYRSFWEQYYFYTAGS
ncbi:peroxisome membrane protein [Radiomyces spectabilis]|uniref:peroxisome membrane protein n=1 Tax=Radiomyces spectabilis TaxID=64574 RepID=UPI00221E5989|nr:peroxisome membrane protein [Radiomyces spectabilis]KAI8365964.1 peroxisome membrane protein [Radiomyces spectabilis]